MPPSSSFTESEKKAYIGLSLLFLDIVTEVDDIASALRPLHIPIATLTDLLRRDVFPILYQNFQSPAPVWEGFDEDWLLSKIEARRVSDPGGAQGRALEATQLKWWQIVAEEWELVKERL